MAFKQLYQNNPQWANKKIGTGSQNLTIGSVGCMLTSLAMVVNYFGGSETPASLNDKMVAAQGFNGAWIKSASVPAQFPQLGMKRQKWVQCADKPAPLDLIDAGLKAGSLILVRVDWQPDPDIDSHWVVVHEKQGDDYLIWDPWQKEDAPNTLAGRYGFSGKQPADIILEAIWHGKGDLPKPGTETAVTRPVPVKPSKPRASKPAPAKPSAAITVQPTVDQLAMRREPQIRSDNIAKRLSSATVLMVLETDSAKIGQRYQWLHVEDPTGTQGYVAAWYVEQVTAVPAPSPTPAAATMQVKTTASSLSFRTEPRVAAETLIRYLPFQTQLDVMEGEDAAQKIGQQDQWLHVRTEDGTEGYVAAWLVSQ